MLLEIHVVLTPIYSHERPMHSFISNSRLLVLKTRTILSSSCSHDFLMHSLYSHACHMALFHSASTSITILSSIGSSPCQ
ncbi:hypothetical protein Syun_031703 [Stephania yunnanensis]|uniref:Uncharacterized protein n=1 Tax=Stephania yunnanensis TaxID=152371 RepID=A0AAP0DZ27_9MAGN